FGLALLAFAGAELIGGNGFIAAFAAGLTLGNTSRSVSTCLWHFGEAEGQLLSLLVFLALGAVLVPDVLPTVGWSAVLYAVLSLTLIRMVPTWLSLLGTGVRPITILFLGWFGPRGIASVVFILLLLDQHAVADRHLIAAVATLTVLVSIFAHGMTAYAGANTYGRRAEAMGSESDAPEHRAVTPLPTRAPTTQGPQGSP
ncbi:MAG: cation:proton antiporter, partial [Gemmatimonadota bacterium]